MTTGVEDLTGAALALARRFAAGATLWCVAPACEPDAHHVAVEFARPLTTGQRALPAFALTGSCLVGRARDAARSGDILMAVAGAGDAVVADLMRRGPAWGVLSVWIGSGRRPAAGAADHVLWANDPGPLASAAGQFAVRCQLLRELTHACFEVPALLTPPAPECTEEICITCSDEGRLAEVLEPPASVFDTAQVRTGTGVEAIDVTLVAPVAVGDLVLVHAGAALTKLGGF